jgi:hypothetical protein
MTSRRCNLPIATAGYFLLDYSLIDAVYGLHILFILFFCLICWKLLKTWLLANTLGDALFVMYLSSAIRLECELVCECYELSLCCHVNVNEQMHFNCLRWKNEMWIKCLACHCCLVLCLVFFAWVSCIGLVNVGHSNFLVLLFSLYRVQTKYTNPRRMHMPCFSQKLSCQLFVFCFCFK